MKKITINIEKFKNEKELYGFLDKELKLSKTNDFQIGLGPDAFWDVYAFSDDNTIFILENYYSLKNKKYKQRVDVFIEVLERLKGYKENNETIIPNPNFNYTIVS